MKAALHGGEFVAPGHEPDPVVWKALREVSYADRFGWHPWIVRDLPADTEPWYIPLHDLILDMRRPKGGGSA